MWDDAIERFLWAQYAKYMGAKEEAPILSGPDPEDDWIRRGDDMKKSLLNYYKMGRFLRWPKRGRKNQRQRLYRRVDKRAFYKVYRALASREMMDASLYLAHVRRYEAARQSECLSWPKAEAKEETYA